MTALISVLCLSEEEKSRARQGFVGGQAVSEAGDYLVGYAPEERLGQMSDSGLIVSLLQEDNGALEFAEDELPSSDDAMVLDDNMGSASATTESVQHFVIAFRRPLGVEEQALVADNGCKLGDRIKDNRYVLIGTLSQAQRLRSLNDCVANVSLYGIEATLDVELHQRKRTPVAAAAQGDDRYFKTTSGTWTTGGDVEDLTLGTSDTHGTATAVGYDALERDLQFETAQSVAQSVHIRCHQPDEVTQLVEKLADYVGISVVEHDGPRIRCELAPEASAYSLLFELGALAPTAQAEVYVEPELLLEYAVPGLFHEGKDETFPFSGEGEMIAIADTGLDTSHPDIDDRFTVIEIVPMSTPYDPYGHGTHVASIAAGSGAASNGRLAGVAPKATIYFQALAGDKGKLQAIKLGLAKILQQAYDAGARIQNLSWGAEVSAGYVLNSWELDEFIYTHPDHLVVVAAGNSGRQNDTGAIDIESVCAPGTAKNALTVGACCSPRTDGPFAQKTWQDYPGSASTSLPPMAELPLTGDINVVAALSSRGPAQGQRIKPDLVAPGIGIAAARSAGSDNPGEIPFDGDTDHYVYKNGTSMAAPMVAGAAALLREYLRKIGLLTPSAALMKAALINGAQWVTGPSGENPDMGQPNVHQGFGRLVLSRVFPDGHDANFDLRLVDIRSGTSAAVRASRDNPVIWIRKLQVLRSEVPLSITMTWTDPPGSGLTHELDLIVIAPDGQRFLGNSGIKRAKWEAVDRLNNVEQVRIATPQLGIWTVRISAQNTYKGSQGFGLAATGAISDWFDE